MIRYIVETTGVGNQVVLPASFDTKFSKDIQVLYDNKVVPANIFKRGSFNFNETVTSTLEASSVKLNQERDGYTVEFWVRPNYDTTGNIVFGYETLVSEERVTEELNITLSENYENSWVHFTTAFSPKIGSGFYFDFYINGELLESNFIETPYFSNEFANFLFGENFNGDVGEIRVWDKYYGEDHIKKYLYRTLTGYENNLKLYYRINKHQGEYINDYSGENFGGVIHSDDLDRFSSETLITLPFNLKESDRIIIQKGKSPYFSVDSAVVQSTISNISYDSYSPYLDVLFLDPAGINTNYNVGEGKLAYQVGDVWIEETPHKGNEDLYNILHSLYIDKKYSEFFKGNLAKLITILEGEQDEDIEKLKRRLDNDDDDIFSIYEYLKEYNKDFLQDYKLTSDLTELASLINDKELQAIIDRNIDNDFDDMFFIQDVFKQWLDRKKENDSEELQSIYKHTNDEFKNYKRIDNDDDDIFAIKDISDTLNRKIDNDSDDIISILDFKNDIKKRIDNDDDDIISLIEPISYRNKAYKSYYKSYSPSEDFYAIIRWSEEQAEKRRIFRNIDNDSEELIGIIQHQIDEKYKYLKGYDETNDATLLDAIIKHRNDAKKTIENNVTKDMMYFIIKTLYGFYNVYRIDIDFTENYVMDLEMLEKKDTYYMEVELI